MKSRFIENLKKLSQSSVPPLGFGRRKEDQKTPPLMIIFSLDSVTEVKEAAGKADAILFSGSKIDKESVKQQIKADAAPWGIALKSSKDTGDFKELGFDFLLLSSKETRAAVLRTEELGKVIEIDADLPDSQLRALEYLPVDALLLPFSGRGNTLTVQELLAYQRADLLVTKPLLGYVPSKISGEDLRLLWEAGLDGVVLKAVEVSGEEMARLKEAIKSFPSHRGEKKRLEALVPPAASPIPEESLEEPE